MRQFLTFPLSSLSSEVIAELPAAAVQADQGEAHDEETVGAHDFCAAVEEAAAPFIAVESLRIPPHADVPLPEVEVEVSAAPACEARPPETIAEATVSGDSLISQLPRCGWKDSLQKWRPEDSRVRLPKGRSRSSRG
ncbi:hypothetical protein Nepgr_018941 [Nepenthes gracilis]|uniref:Uncharacterized protein n=1 Tax=Nepenthes gracilis TaxID=150966 RepID=A0AAD3XUR7_NEPGR|nr:hypothetical protein Nepgr_018941 [Nepenthes gracilis]